MRLSCLLGHSMFLRRWTPYLNGEGLYTYNCNFCSHRQYSTHKLKFHRHILCFLGIHYWWDQFCDGHMSCARFCKARPPK